MLQHLRLRRHAALVHDGVAQGSAHRQPQRLSAVLVPHATGSYRHADGPAAALVDQHLPAAQVAAAAQNALPLLGLVGLVVAGQGVGRDGPVGVLAAEHGPRVSAVVHAQLAAHYAGHHAGGARALDVDVGGVEVVLHHVEGVVHVQARGADEVREGLPAAPRHVVAVLAVAIQHAVQMHVSAVEVLEHEEVVLVDPVGVAGLQAAHGVHRRVGVLLSGAEPAAVHGATTSRPRARRHRQSVGVCCSAERLMRAARGVGEGRSGAIHGRGDVQRCAARLVRRPLVAAAAAHVHHHRRSVGGPVDLRQEALLRVRPRRQHVGAAPVADATIGCRPTGTGE